MLLGKPAEPEGFQAAAEALLHGAKGYEHNMFKIGLAKESVVHALSAFHAASIGLQHRTLWSTSTTNPADNHRADGGHFVKLYL